MASPDRSTAKVAHFGLPYGDGYKFGMHVCMVCGKKVTNLARHIVFMVSLDEEDPDHDGHLALSVMES